MSWLWHYKLNLSSSRKSFYVQRLEKSFQKIILHVVMSKTILLEIFGIITGLQICQFSNTFIIWMGWVNLSPMLNYFFKKVWHCKVGALFLGHPVQGKKSSRKCVITRLVRPRQIRASYCSISKIDGSSSPREPSHELFLTGDKWNLVIFSF